MEMQFSNANFQMSPSSILKDKSTDSLIQYLTSYNPDSTETIPRLQSQTHSVSALLWLLSSRTWEEEILETDVLVGLDHRCLPPKALDYNPGNCTVKVSDKITYLARLPSPVL